MEAPQKIEATSSAEFNPHIWMGLVLDHFARAEQAIGRLSVLLDLPIRNGSLGSLNEIRNRLQKVGSKQCRALDQRVAGWSTNRPYRHLLAHATITTLVDAGGNMIVVTRHLPLDINDVTPDRMWTAEDQKELLRQATNDSRSICDQVRNLSSDLSALQALREA